jgi:Carboxypeptidase regulatory-like domain
MEPPANTWKKSSPPTTQQRHRRLSILVGAAAVLALLVCVVVWMLQPPPRLHVVLLGNDRHPTVLTDADDWRNCSRDELRLRLKNWNAATTGKAELVYLSGSVHVDAAGQLVLGSADEQADHARNPIRLGDLLYRLPKCEHGLVVLDLACAETDWVPLARSTVEEKPELPWSILFARSRGEADASGLEGIVHDGWTGQADGCNPTQERDHRVGFDELAAYIRSRRLTDEPPLGEGRTTPWWIKRGTAVSFAPAKATPHETITVEDRTYPLQLRAAWPNVDQPTAKAKFLQLEQRWLQGEPVEAILKESQPAPKSDNGLSAGVQAWVNRIQRPKTGEPVPPLPEDILLAVLKQPEGWTQPMLLELSAASKLTIVEPRSAATLQLWRAAGSPTETYWPLLLRNIRATIAWEECRNVPGNMEALREAARQWHAAWATIFANGYCRPETAEQATTAFEDRMRRLQEEQVAHAEILVQLQNMDTLTTLLKPSTEFTALYQSLQKNVRSALAPAKQVMNLETASWTSEQRLPALQRVRAGSNTPQDWALLRRWLDTGLGSFDERAEVWNLWLAADAARQRRNQQRVQSGVAPVWLDADTEQPAPVVQNTPWRRATPALVENRQEWLDWHTTQAAWEETNPLGFANPEAEMGWAKRLRLSWQAAGGQPQPVVVAELRPEPAVWPANGTNHILGATVRLTDRISESHIRAESPSETEIRLTPSETKVPTSIVQSRVTWQATLVSPVDAGVSCRGVLLSLDTVHGPVFARLPIDTRALTQPLRLLVVQNDDKPLSLEKLLLRPNGQPVVAGFALASRSAESRRVIVECPALQLTTGEVVLAPQSHTLLTFQRAPAPVPPVEPVRLSSLEFVVRDAATKAISQTITLPLEAMDPRSLVSVKSAVVSPTAGGADLRFDLRRTAAISSPLRVTLDFPANRNEGLTIRSGLLGSHLQPADNTLSLSASLIWSNGRRKSCEVQLSVDGVARALVFRGDVTNLSREVPLSVLTTPSLRLETPTAHDGNRALSVRVECDAEPPGATLHCVVGIGRDGEFRPEFEARPVEAKTTVILAQWHESGGLSFAATRKDGTVAIPIGRLAGKRWLRGELRDARGVVLATEWRPLVFDADPPKNLKFADVPQKTKRGQPLKLLLEVEPPPGGLKDIRVFTGIATNGEPEAAATVFAAAPVDAKQRQWAVTLPMADRLGPVLIHATARSNSGLTATIQKTVDLVDAAELDTAKPGEVSGVVVEGDVVQPKLVVTLTNAKKKSLTATTDENGRFQFNDVPPGNYTLSAVKSSTSRGASLPVIVKPGDSTRAELSLLLQSR